MSADKGQTDMPGTQGQPGAPWQPAPSSEKPASFGGVPAFVRRSGAAVWWGIVLIVVGLLFLVTQFAPGVHLWRYWPLIIVALGVRAMFGPGPGPWSVRYLAEGLSTVALGLVLLGQMLGYLGWDVWLNILRLWPLLLVALGLEVMGRGLRTEWLRALGSLVIVAGLAYGALVMTPTDWSAPRIGRESTSFTESAGHDRGISEGSASVTAGLGEFTLRGGGELATAKGASPLEPRFEALRNGSKATVRIDLGKGVVAPGQYDSWLDVTLDRAVWWDLDVSAGVGNFDVDLSDVPVSRLTLKAGVSEGSLKLGPPRTPGDARAVPVRVEVGVSSLTLRVPEGSPIRVKVGAGLTSIEALGSWDEWRSGSDRIYESPSLDGSSTYWDVTVSAGVGSITVEYY